ncbi:MAG: hypothetical protein K1060chlam4_01708 [Candidatus Anoxychlamydiales bacterium]|nr:hypothetical protein [Candidatus Anoxychlamydiales bacterium]
MVQPVDGKTQVFFPAASAENDEKAEIKVKIIDYVHGVKYCCKGTFRASHTLPNLSEQDRIRSMLEEAFPQIKNCKCTAVRQHYLDLKDSSIE